MKREYRSPTTTYIRRKSEYVRGRFTPLVLAKPKPFIKRMQYGLAAALFILSSVVIQAIGPVNLEARYNIDSQLKQLVGESRDDTKQYLKLDKDSASYKFVVPEDGEGGEAKKLGRNEAAYSASFPLSAKEGISYTDNTAKIDMKLTPKFFTSDGKQTEGDHVVYPIPGGKLVYTLKYNGLKEDIILPQYINDSMTYEFEMSLPTGTEARLDESGNIHIYSSDPTLFGNISFGSDEDRAKVDKARENGEKTNLVATIPAPIIKDANGKDYTDRSKFSLSDGQLESSIAKVDDNLPAEVREKLQSTSTRRVYTLGIESKRLKDLAYPISIDPTIQTSSASDFGQGNNESGVEVDTTNNLIRRSSLTGGYLNTWSTTGLAVLPAARYVMGTTSYNGYIYVTGGENVGHQSTVYVSKVDSSGNLTSPNLSGCGGATWCTTSSMLTQRVNHAAVAYNSYLYIVGGHTTDFTSSVEYAKINSDGSLGSFASTSSLTEAKQVGGEVVAYNGYLYAVGGCNNSCNTLLTTVERVQINADGSLGTWTTSGNTQLSLATRNNQILAYGGRIYSIGGNNQTDTKAVIVANIQSDSTVGSWRSLTNMNANRPQGHAVAVISGYIYAMGGCQEDTCNSRNSDTEYAQINADGSIGSWKSTAAYGDINRAGYTVVNNKIFSTGGCFGGPACTVISTVQGATIKPAGELDGNAWTSGGNISTARVGHGTFVYNSYIYAVGGWTSGTSASTVVDYAPLNANGSIGTWTTTTALPGGRHESSVFAYNGYVYVVGGCSTLSANVCSNQLDTTYYAALSASGGVTTNGVGSCQGGGAATWCLDSSNPMNSPRIRTAGTAYNGYVYIAGDTTTDVATSDDIEYAQITTSDGSIGTWTAITTGNVLSAGRMYFQMVAFNNFLYVTGGVDAGGARLPTVQYAQLSSNVPGAWSSGASLNTNRGAHGTALSNGYIYVFGGDTTSGTATRTVEYSRIKSDGTLDTWVATTSLANDHTQGSGAANNGVLYSVAGRNNGGSLQQYSEYQFINNGGPGTAGTWTNDTTNLPATRGYHRTEVLNGYIYSISGCSTGTQTDCTATGNVQYAQISADGSLSAWSNTSSGPTARVEAGSFVYNGRIYILGGQSCIGGVGTACNGNPTYPQTIQYATPAANGDITSWTTNSVNLPGAMTNVGFAAYDGYVYRAGGVFVSTTSAYAGINNSLNEKCTGPAGDICTWTAGPTMFEDTYSNGVVAYNGYLYSVNGNTGSPSETKTVQVAQINSDHTLGSWSTTTPTIFATQGPNVAIYNGYIYRVAGYDGANPGTVANTEYAPILPGGKIGAWQRSTPVLTTGRYYAGLPIWNGRMYLIAGLLGTTFQSAQEYTTLQSTPRTGSYSRLVDFGNAVRPTKLITRGTKQVGATVGLSYSASDESAIAFGTATSSSDIGYTGANAHTLSPLAGVTTSRYLFLRYAMDDSQSGIFPDSGNESTITDYDVYFTSNPGTRLRGGRTFTNGVDRGLDAPF